VLKLSLETIAERLAKFEELASNNKEDIGNHNERITNIERKNDSLIEMKTLLHMQMDITKEYQGQMKEVVSTLNSMNTNLTQLNISQTQLKEDVINVGSRVTDVEKSLDGNKIDIVKWIKNAAWLVFIGFILWKLGIK
jgi:predicted  nucleic acid-binding Zn-ribbon protein